MRDRLVFAGLALLACAWLACTNPVEPPAAELAAAPADLVLVNAAVYTVDGARSWAEAIAIAGGRIRYVGSSAGARELAGESTRVVDLAGRMVLPGFQDSHVHPVDAGVAESQCPVFDLESAAAVVEKVAHCAQADPGTGWIVGSGWAVDLFVPSGVPDKQLLDAVAPDRPVALFSTDGHSLWVNSRALAIAGITAATPDPPRGRIDRNPGGSEPAGGLQEEAMELVAKHLPPLTDTQLADGLRIAARTLNGFGITSIQDAMVKLDGGDAYTGFSAYHALDDAGELPLRVVTAMYWDTVTDIDAQVARLVKARSDHTRGRVRATSVKIFQDGVLETGTAALLEPYLDAAPGFRGELLNAQPRLDQAVTRLDALGFQLHFHAIGDAAIRSALDAIEAARRANGSRDARHHVSHLELVDPADIPRFRALGVVANFQPLWAYADAYVTDLTLPRIGSARGRWLYPMASFRDAGVPIAFGSDWSVSSANPLLGIETAVTRLDALGGADARKASEPFLPQERLSLADAIASYTIESAYVNFHERDTGSIEVGKLADLTVLDRNLFAIPPADISEVRVVATLLEGELVHGELPVSGIFDAIVIGAGFAGLGAGAALRARGVSRFAIVEQGDSVGHFWTKTYDRIHLHSAYHDLPDDGGLRREYGIFLTRDELLDYFRRYAERHRLAPHLRFDTRVTRVKRIDPGAAGGAEWELATTAGTLSARYLAVATAMNRVPVVPDIPGRERFRGRVLHSAEYRNAQPFAGRRVLVVGSGNSAAEVSLDLALGGAASVAMWVRGPRHFLPLSRVAWLFRLIRLLGQFTPAKIEAMHRISAGTPEFDRTTVSRDKVMARLSVDLSRYGIRKPAAGPAAETFLCGRIPTFDVGAIAKIRSGAIRVIDGNARPIAGFEETGVRLGDTTEPFDAVILGTGFDPGLGEFIADAELLGPVRWHPLLPLTDGRCRSRIHPSIFFPGFDATPLGGISLGYWGRDVGWQIADELAARSSRPTSGQMAASANTDATMSCQPSAS